MNLWSSGLNRHNLAAPCFGHARAVGKKNAQNADHVMYLPLQDNAWNQEMLQHVAKVYVKAVMGAIDRFGNSAAQWLATCPLRPSRLTNDFVMSALCPETLRCLKAVACIPAQSASDTFR